MMHRLQATQSACCHCAHVCLCQGQVFLCGWTLSVVKLGCSSPKCLDINMFCLILPCAWFAGLPHLGLVQLRLPDGGKARTGRADRPSFPGAGQLPCRVAKRVAAASQVAVCAAKVAQGPTDAGMRGHLSHMLAVQAENDTGQHAAVYQCTCKKLFCLELVIYLDKVI
jgi:hypothetical protein